MIQFSDVFTLLTKCRFSVQFLHNRQAFANNCICISVCQLPLTGMSQHCKEKLDSLKKRLV